jgi:hypothetical protein
VEYYTAYSHNSLPTFRKNLKVPYSRAKISWLLKVGSICCPEMSVRVYHYALPNGDFVSFEYGTDRLSRNVGKSLPLYAA